MAMIADAVEHEVEVRGYMDETGHSSDQRQRFNGMAGLIAPASHWKELERKWKETLDAFKITHFHMTEFENSERARNATRSKNVFKNWSSIKKEKLFSKLLKIIETTHAFPVGSVISMDDFRSLSDEQRKLFDDPYYLGFANMLAYVDFFLKSTGSAPEVKAAIVFSDQVEFRYRALQYYETAYSKELTTRIKPPSFDNMRDRRALQAADIIAFEFYRECERQRYRPNDEPRPGYQTICKMSNRLGFQRPLIHFQQRDELLAHAENVGKHLRRLEYWQKKKRGASAGEMGTEGEFEKL